MSQNATTQGMPRADENRPVVLEAALLSRSFRAFVAVAWEVAQPGRPYVPTIATEAVCEHLEAVARHQIRRLVIALPFRQGKSTLASVLFPAWLWTWDPSRRLMFASYAEDLALRDAVRSRRLMQSAWYRARWGNRWAFVGDQNVKGFYENDRTGYRFSLGVGSGGTGKGGDIRVIDDAHKAMEALSDRVRESTIEWHDQEWASRNEDDKTACSVVIGQRFHERDLSGVLIERGGYELLKLPMEYEPTRRAPPTSIGWEDPRTEPGALLSPERVGPVELAEHKRTLGAYGTAGQLQQEPIPLAGALFKPSWWRYFRSQWSPTGSAQPALPTRSDWCVCVWDLSFKETQDGSFVAGGLLLGKGADRYLVDVYHERVDFPVALEAVRSLRVTAVQRFGRCDAVLVEEKANGAAVISTLRREIPGLVPLATDGSKEARAAASSPTIQAGNFWLPENAPWLHEYQTEMQRFPRYPTDDYVDMTAHGINWLNGRTPQPVSALKLPQARDAGASQWRL